jgi:hypothetical protein
LLTRRRELLRLYKRAQSDKEKEDITSAGLLVRQEMMNYLEQETLGDMRRDDRMDEAEMEVALLITWVQDQLNVQAPLLEDQILTASAMIVGSYGSLRLADVAICFRNAVGGHYQRQYGKVDVQDLLAWVEIYHQALVEKRSMAAQSGHLAAKATKWDKRYSKSLRAVIHNHQHGNKNG